MVTYGPKLFPQQETVKKVTKKPRGYVVEELVDEVVKDETVIVRADSKSTTEDKPDVVTLSDPEPVQVQEAEPHVEGIVEIGTVEVVEEPVLAETEPIVTKPEPVSTDIEPVIEAEPVIEKVNIEEPEIVETPLEEINE